MSCVLRLPRRAMRLGSARTRPLVVRASVSRLPIRARCPGGTTHRRGLRGEVGTGAQAAHGSGALVGTEPDARLGRRLCHGAPRRGGVSDGFLEALAARSRKSRPFAGGVLVCEALCLPEEPLSKPQEP